MATDFYDFEEEEPQHQGRDHLFLWTVFILLLIGMAFACWLGSFYIFGHPEQPRSYQILKKLKKLQPPQRFEVTAAPPGEFMGPQKLFEKYSKYSRLQLEEENAELMRNYIKNYKESKKLVPYMTGKFEIVDTYVLKPTDLFPSGVVALAAADEFAQVVIEHIFTTAPENVEGLKSNLPRGLDMRLERTRDLAAVIHIERTEDGRLLFTAVPLLYGSWGLKGSIGSFSLEPPETLNLKAGAPIMKGPAFVERMVAYAAYRRSKPALASANETKTTAPTEPELVRVDSVKPGATVPATGAMPELPVATPIPVATPKGQKGPMVAGRATPKSSATPPRFAAANPTPFSIPKLPPIVLNTTPTPAPTPVAMAHPGVPLKPFVSSAPAGMPTGGGTWRTYDRGQQPPGRTITPAEATAMAEKGGQIAERLYLRGDFIVTASGENRAILRSSVNGSDGTRPGTGAARIIVEFPPSALPPAEGSTFSRDDSAAFEVKEVRRTADGQINIYVREITRGG